MNHWIPTAHRPTAGRIEDHVLLLQLERANEALSDRVDFLEDKDDDSCSCDCAESGLDRLHERVSDGNDRMLEMADLITHVDRARHPARAQ